MRIALLLILVLMAPLAVVSVAGEIPEVVCGPVPEARTSGCYRCQRATGRWVGHGSGVGRSAPDGALLSIVCDDPWCKEPPPAARASEFAALKRAASSAPTVVWTRTPLGRVATWVVTMFGPEGKPEAKTETNVHMSTGLVVTRVVEIEP